MCESGKYGSPYLESFGVKTHLWSFINNLTKKICLMSKSKEKDDKKAAEAALATHAYVSKRDNALKLRGYVRDKRDGNNIVIVRAGDATSINNQVNTLMNESDITRRDAIYSIIVQQHKPFFRGNELREELEAEELKKQAIQNAYLDELNNGYLDDTRF